MSELVSPDIAAYWCYFAVVAFGLASARMAVNRLLDSSFGRWSFIDTWWIFYAQAVIPLLLFWLLDFSNVIRDTSLFAALVVAVGYQQIFAGGVKEITLPGQTSRLWQPFELWRNKVANDIARLARTRLDRFDQAAIAHVADDPARLNTLAMLSLQHSTTPQDLATQVAAHPGNPAPGGSQPALPARLALARLLLHELRSQDATRYGRLLYQRGLTPRPRLLGLFNLPRLFSLFNLPEMRNLLGASLGFCTLPLLAVACVFLASRDEGLEHRYYRWRLTKPNASVEDRYRTREYFLQLLTEHTLNAQVMLAPATRLLRFDNLSDPVASEILYLAAHSDTLTLRTFWVSELISGLRNRSPSTRLRIHNTLLSLAAKSGMGRALPSSLTDWKITNDDTPAQVQQLVDQWNLWFKGYVPTPPA